MLARRRRRCSSRSGCRCAASWPRVVARSPFGQGAAWPVVRDRAARRHLRRGAGAGAGADPASAPARPSSWRCGIAGELDVVGVLAVELFERTDGALLVNELAMRPHNSGALDDRGRPDLAVRAAPAGRARLPARRDRADRAGGGDGERAGRAADGGPGIDERLHHLFAALARRLKVHLYGKQPRPGRKIGHVTALGDDLDGAARGTRPRRAAYLATGVSDEVTHSEPRWSASSWAATRTGR